MSLLDEEINWVNENLQALLDYYSEFNPEVLEFKPHFVSFIYNNKINYEKIRLLLESIGLANYDLEIVFYDDLSSLADYEVVENEVFDSNFEIINQQIIIEIPKSRRFFDEAIDFEIILNVCAAKLDIDELDYRSNVDDGAFRILSVLALLFNYFVVLIDN